VAGTGTGTETGPGTGADTETGTGTGAGTETGTGEVHGERPDVALGHHREAARRLWVKGNRLLLKGEVTEAIRTLARAIEYDPAYAKAYRSLGVAFAKNGDTALAVQSYKEYLRRAPEAPDADQVRRIIEAYERK
jgi:tetratricopeptide (TPR) repeat protein